MLSALRTPAQQAGRIRMIPRFLTMVPRAAAVALAGVVLTGGAMGASAAVGGPNIPDAVLTAFGVLSGHEGGPDLSSCDESTGSERGECVSGIATSHGGDSV